MGFSWVQPKRRREVLVAWRRRLKKRWVIGVWKLMPWLFGEVLGR